MAALTVADLKLLIESSFKMKGKLKFTFSGVGTHINVKNNKVISIKITDANDIELSDDTVLKTVTNSYIVSKYKFSGTDKFSASGIFSNDATIKYIENNFPCKD